MTPAERSALADIRGYAGANRIRIEWHARERMRDRNVRYDELRHALVTARTCTIQANGRIRVRGFDLDGAALDPVVALDGEVVVITLLG
jgi:Domain of unknown function (DUF4258)